MVVAAEPRAPVLVQRLKEPAPGPHSGLVSVPDEARAVPGRARAPVRALVPERAEAPLPARVPAAQPVRPAPAPVRGPRPRSPTAAR